MDEHGLSWQDVESLIIFLPTGEHSRHIGVWDSPSRLRPKNRDSANHSPIYSVAVAMIDRALGPEQYADAKLNDPNVHSMIDRISLSADTALDPHWPAASITRVALKTMKGATLEATTPYPPGHHKNRLDDAQAQQKFRRLTASLLSRETQDAIIDAAGRLDTLDSVEELMRLLRRER